MDNRTVLRQIPKSKGERARRRPLDREMKRGLIAPANYGNAAASTCQQTIEERK